MTAKRAQATVPLDIAEFLRVTLQIAKQSESLTTDQKSRIGMVLAMYECKRDEHLLSLGFTSNQIAGYAKSAALALANYFEDKANETLEGGDCSLLEPPCLEDSDDFEDFEAQFRDHLADPD